MLNKKWYAIYTRAKAEKKVYKQLKEKGIEAFLPLQTTLKQWSDRKKKVEEPLFRSYIFVKIDYIKEYVEVLQTYGAVYFVKINKIPVVVRDNHIEIVRRLINEGKTIEISNERFPKGAEVTIKAGPFSGFEGEVIAHKGHNKLKIHVKAVGSSILVEIPTEHMVQL